MEYNKLTKFFYKYGPEPYHDEIYKRKNSYGSYLTPLFIRGFRKGQKLTDTFQLFYVHTHKLFSLNNKVLINSSKISALISKLPKFIIEPYFHKLIINEAQSNNEIEGVRSTKKELKEVLEDILRSDKTKKRFDGLMKTYLFIDDIEPFKEIADFRSLYDQLVSDEIDKENVPDGELFRKSYVEVNDGTQTTHIGIQSEIQIIEALNTLIHYLDDQNHSELYRYMVAHYYYEYIHPFYDGNGRTGRLLICSYISRYLERYSAISLSYAINKNKSKYYKALEEIPTPLNNGEMTFYLIDMLELLAAGQEGIIDDLEINLSKMERIEGFFKSTDWDQLEEEADMLEIMTNLSVFVNDEASLSVTDLMEISKKSRYKVNKIMEVLEEGGYVRLVRKRPKSYQVTDKLLNDLLIM
ncbi:Fic family protein [Oceanobacillus locisalsi]|uniref:Fic family protein n=1 Tax=Oceanobacillus locisalsi TaxID=546107 RepID=A0ABW3NDM7_9BACI